MYKPPIEIVMKEVFQKMNEDFENSVLKAVQKVGINVDKEELLKALIYDRRQYDKGYEDAMNEIKHPQPLKFEDFKRNMYVWDNEYKAIGKVDEVLTNCNCERLHIRYSNGGEIVDYTKNRFYPIIIPNIGDKSEKHI